MGDQATTNENQLAPAADIQDLLSEAAEAFQRERSPDYETAIKAVSKAISECKDGFPGSALQHLLEGLNYEGVFLTVYDNMKKIAESNKGRPTRVRPEAMVHGVRMRLAETRAKYEKADAEVKGAVEGKLPHASQTAELFKLSLARLDAFETRLTAGEGSGSTE